MANFKHKILYVTSEFHPFFSKSPMGPLVRNLAQSMRQQDIDVRVFMPCFGVINHRKNRIHEIIRLAGINIPLGEQELEALVIRVASIREAKFQVYLMDNEIFFQRKGSLYSKEGKFYADNALRSIFFCKSVLATVKQLEWTPDIIHCHGWFTALVLAYLKAAYKASPILGKAKSIYTLYPDGFTHTFGKEIIQQAMMHDMQTKHLKALRSFDFTGFIKLGIQYADKVTQLPTPPLDYPDDLQGPLKTANALAIAHDEQLVESYNKVYSDLLSG